MEISGSEGEAPGGGGRVGDSVVTRLSLRKKLFFGAAFTGLGLVLIEVTCLLLVRFLPGYEPEGIQMFRNYHTREDGRPLFMTMGMAKRLDTLLDETVIFNLMANDVTQPDPDLIFRVRPRSGEIEGAGDLTINSLGFRGEEFNLEDASPLRVMVLGDSCAFGWWIPDITKTWPRKMEELLEERCGETTVFNLAQPGYSTHQCALLFDRWFDQIRPDYVVLYAGWNDLHQATITDRQTVAILRATMSPATMWLRGSHTYNFFEQTMMKWRMARVTSQGRMDGVGRRVPTEESVKNIRRMIEAAKTADCGVFIVMPPFSSDRAPGTEHGFGNMLEYRNAIAEGVGSDAFVVIFEQLEYGRPDSREYFVAGDGYHPNDSGALVIAHGLARAIADLADRKRSATRRD